MRVLIVGGGGREHAIAWKIRQSSRLTELYVAPGNAGTSLLATNVELSATRVGALALWAVEHKIDLTVVGPEAPLAEGLVNVFQEHGLKVFGPSREAAQLEWSKAFAKDVMLKAGVRTARGAVFADYNEACDYARANPGPLVVKADGLAAGKGVVVADTIDEVLATLKEFMIEGAHGAAGKTVVLEERLQGKEASVMALVDGETVLPLVPSQDYKRVSDGDIGPNTGGMGAISPAPVLGDNEVDRLVETVFLPTVRELYRRGIRYTGFLYAGVMVTGQGEVNVLEFNCRLGDPETQVLMLRMQSDLLTALQAAVDGRLATINLAWSRQGAACVVLASEGYPAAPVDGKIVSGLDDVPADCVVFHAGTEAQRGGRVLTKGGRILAVGALAPTVQDAANRAYEGVSLISFEGMHYRRDIGR